MSRRRFAVLVVAILALNAFFWLAQGGFALPRAVIDRFFGPRLVRAEVILRGGRGAVRDFRLDRGVVTSVSRRELTLREQDGTSVTISLAPVVRVVGLGRGAGAARLRPGMRVLVVRQANVPARLIQLEATGS